MQEAPIESHVRLWLDEWKDRWHALPVSILPRSPFTTISGHFLVSRAPSHQQSLGDLIVQGLLGDAQAIVLAHELGSIEVLAASRGMDGFAQNRAAINDLVAGTLKSRVPAGQSNPFADAIFNQGMLRIYLRLAAGDPVADAWITQFFANDPVWRRAEYLFLCSLPELLSNAPHLGIEKSAPTWKELADSRHPDLVKSGDPDFEDFVRRFLEARRIAKARKPEDSAPRSKSSQADRFRDVVLEYWLPLGLWLMEYDDALGALRQLALLPGSDLNGVTNRKKAVSKLATMVREKGLHHHPATPMASLVVKDAKVVGCKWKDGVGPHGPGA